MKESEQHFNCTSSSQYDDIQLHIARPYISRQSLLSDWYHPSLYPTIFSSRPSLLPPPLSLSPFPYSIALLTRTPTTCTKMLESLLLVPYFVNTFDDKLHPLIVNRRTTTQGHRSEDRVDEPTEGEAHLTTQGHYSVFGECSTIDCMNAALIGTPACVQH